MFEYARESLDGGGGAREREACACAALDPACALLWLDIDAEDACAPCAPCE